MERPLYSWCMMSFVTKITIMISKRENMSSIWKIYQFMNVSYNESFENRFLIEKYIKYYFLISSELHETISISSFRISRSQGSTMFLYFNDELQDEKHIAYIPDIIMSISPLQIRYEGLLICIFKIKWSIILRYDNEIHISWRKYKWIWRLYCEI